MSGPVGVQRKRTRGWRMPRNTVSVSRPGPWGNPFVPGFWCIGWSMREAVFVEDAAHAVRLYRRYAPLSVRITAKVHLKGKNLACWCGLDKPCHRNVLLRWANR